MVNDGVAILQSADYLFAAQYANGGWPQYYPKLEGYYRHITFNDNAMIGVMTLLRDISEQRPDYAFVDVSRREKAAGAVRKGIKCILDCQIIVDGKRTVWCAQHDEVTFKPAPARTYEKASYSGSESAGIVRLIVFILCFRSCVFTVHLVTAQSRRKGYREFEDFFR
jgi:PelA/Pel-15E family pectate lyase